MGAPTVTERTITGPDGRTQTFRLRPELRKDEASTHVTGRLGARDNRTA
jgi:hypothetical protein